MQNSNKRKQLHVAELHVLVQRATDRSQQTRHHSACRIPRVNEQRIIDAVPGNTTLTLATSNRAHLVLLLRTSPCTKPHHLGVLQRGTCIQRMRRLADTGGARCALDAARNQCELNWATVDVNSELATRDSSPTEAPPVRHDAVAEMAVVDEAQHITRAKSVRSFTPAPEAAAR